MSAALRQNALRLLSDNLNYVSNQWGIENKNGDNKNIIKIVALAKVWGYDIAIIKSPN